jgi:transcriptional regulator GlxA family with amidase domain
MFQQQTGMTPFYYLRTKRIEEAAKDLRQNGLPVHTIAMLTGFDNSSYFGKVFRRLVGVSPQQFRDGKVEVPVNALVIE